MGVRRGQGLVHVPVLLRVRQGYAMHASLLVPIGHPCGGVGDVLGLGQLLLQLLVRRRCAVAPLVAVPRGRGPWEGHLLVYQG